MIMLAVITLYVFLVGLIVLVLVALAIPIARNVIDLAGDVVGLHERMKQAEIKFEEEMSKWQ